MVGEYCGIVPRRPATAGAARRRAAPRRRGATTPLLAHALADAPPHSTSARFDPRRELIPDLAVERVPAGATLLDLRTREEFAEWHPAGALRLDFADALRAYPSFAPDASTCSTASTA